MNAPTCAPSRRSHVGELTDELVSLAAQILKDGPTIATAKRLGVVGELLAAHLHQVAVSHRRRKFEPQRVMKHLTADHENHVSYLRRERGLGMLAFVERAGISRRAVTDAEFCRVDQKMSTMLAIANALQTPAADIWPALKAVKVSK